MAITAGVLGVVALGVFLTFALGCQSGEPLTVRALRYKRIDYESGLAFSHGMGQWHEELYFPERGVRANLGWTEADDGNRDVPFLSALFGSIANKSLLAGPILESEHPTEEVQVAKDLAERIFALAELQKKLNEEKELLGGLTEKTGVLHMKVKRPLEQE
jgi:hypothetical protein